MLRFNLILLILLATLTAVSQNNQYVISATGNHFENSNLKIDYTVGETVISTISNDNIILTQGFHQPKYEITSIEKSEYLNIKFKLFPNPTSDVLNIAIENADNQDLFIELYDISGTLLLKKRIINSTQNIDMKNYSSSIYILHIFNKNGVEVGSYKILKR